MPLIFVNLFSFLNSEKFEFLKCLFLASLLFLASFTFWLLSPHLFTLSFLFVLTVVTQKNLQAVLQCLFRLFVLVVIFLALASPIIFAVGYETIHSGKFNNSDFVPTFGNQQGGIWSMLAFKFSWAIYTIWYGRTLYPFHEYFLSFQYMLGVWGIYLAVGLAFSRIFLMENDVFRFRRANLKIGTPQILIALLCTFLLSVFLGKAAQEPFGEIFVYFYENFQLFKIFRSADARFGFSIIFSLAMILTILTSLGSRKFQHVIASLLMLSSVLTSVHLFNGNALRGMEIDEKFFDRIVEVDNETVDAANFLNQRSMPGDMSLNLPATTYTKYINGNSLNISNDILKLLLTTPLVDLDLT